MSDLNIFANEIHILHTWLIGLFKIQNKHFENFDSVYIACVMVAQTVTEYEHWNYVQQIV